MKFRLLIVVTLFFCAITFSGCRRASAPQVTLTQVRFGISPFQDTLLPVIGDQKGWYAEEGLKVDFKILGWTEVMEALSSNQIDVAINNISSVVGTHARNPEIIYYYGLNPFDNGFALMIRPGGRLKTLAEMSKTIPDHEAAIRATAAQLKGRTVITTGNTDMEQGVAAAARRGGLDFKKDVRVIDLNPDEGLAAFLRGEGDAYIGGIPQRTRAGKEGMIEMLTGADLGPPPINGLVTTKTYMREHNDVLLKLLHVWFRSVRFVDGDIDQGGSIIIGLLNRNSAANFTLDDFKRFWNNYEHYPAGPTDAAALILDPNGRNYWKKRWDDCNVYFYEIKKVIPSPVDPKDTFAMPMAQEAYLRTYGTQ